MSCKRLLGAGAVLLVLAPAAAWADFDLPILFPVPKTVVVSEDVSPEVLDRFSKVDDLVLEIQMTGGNMLRDVLINRMKKLFQAAKIRIVWRGEVNDIHVRQIRQLGSYEVVYRVGEKGLSRKTHNALYALGPIRKYIVFPNRYDENLLSRIAKLKFYVPVIELGTAALDAQLADWLAARKLRSTHFVVSARTRAEHLYDLLQFRPVHLTVQTQNNRIPVGLLKVIRGLKDVGLLLAVDGRLAMDDVREMATLERFGLRIDLGHPARYTPGLAGLLNRITPP
jgi:hypothetical protein